MFNYSDLKSGRDTETRLWEPVMCLVITSNKTVCSIFPINNQRDRLFLYSCRDINKTKYATQTHKKKNYEVKKKIVNVERGIKSFKIEQRWIIAISLAFCLTLKVLPLVWHSIDFLGVQFNAGYFRVYVLNRRQPSCLI